MLENKVSALTDEIILNENEKGLKFQPAFTPQPVGSQAVKIMNLIYLKLWNFFAMAKKYNIK